MGGKKSPQIHHHHSGDKEPLERNCPPTPYTTQNFQLSEKLVWEVWEVWKLVGGGVSGQSPRLPTYPSPKPIFLKERS